MDGVADLPGNLRLPGRAAWVCTLVFAACSFDAAGGAPAHLQRADGPGQEPDASTRADAAPSTDAHHAADAPSGGAGSGGQPALVDASSGQDAAHRPDATRPADAPPMSACRPGETFESFERLPSGGSLPGWNEEVSGVGRAAIVSTADILANPGPGAGSSTSWVRLDGPSTFGADGTAAVITPPVDLHGCAGSTFAFSFLVFDLEPMTSDAAEVEGRVQGGAWLPLARLFPSTSFPDTNDTCQVGSQQPGTPCWWALLDLPVPPALRGPGFQLRFRATVNSGFDALGIDDVRVRARP